MASTSVLDASALLAFAQGEDGASIVEQALVDGACCSAVNWSEIAQKTIAAGRDWSLVAALLDAYEVEVFPVERADAEAAARIWSPGSGLSLADRMCLALGDRLGVLVLTADSAWGSTGGVVQIRPTR